MFLYENLLLFQSQSCLLESTAAIFRQSAGYVLENILTQNRTSHLYCTKYVSVYGNSVLFLIAAQR